MKNRNFDKEAAPNFCLERATIARAQGASEEKNLAAEPTRSKNDSSCVFGIHLMQHLQGILPIDKPTGRTSFSLVSQMRRITGVQKIGHTGTLDPFASGVLILLIGKKYTRLSDTLLAADKQYAATLHLGVTTDSYDIDGTVLAHNPRIPPLKDIEQALAHFQGTLLQTPPMFSAKKVNGKKLYELARKGIEIERKAVPVTLHTTLLSYEYPYLKIDVRCSKGTYIRSLAHDMGQVLGCGAHLSALTRVQNGAYTLAQCCNGARLTDPTYNWTAYLLNRPLA